MEYISKSGPVVNASPENVIPEPSDEFVYSAPVALRKLDFGDDFVNKSITGTFYTDSTGDSLLFITAYRQGPDDGYNYASFYNGYGVAVRIGGKSEDDPHNIFVVQNSLGVKQVVVEQVIHTGWGDYGYLASTASPINTYTTYSYELIFLPGGGLEFYLWTTTKPLIPTLSYGAFQHNSTGSYYGVSCSQTQGDKWIIGEIYLSNVTSNYAMQLSRLDVSELGASFTVNAQAFAVGYNAGLVDNAGIIMYCYNHATGEWVEQDRHYFSAGGGDIRLTSDELLATQYASTNIPITVDVLLVSIYPSNYDNGVDSYIYVDYIKAESWSTEFSHIGGKGDIYIKDTASLTSMYLDIMNCDIREFLIPTNPKITTDFSLPMLWVDNVELLDFAGNPTGSYLVRNTDWAFECTTPGSRFSPKEEILLILASAGWNLRVHYHTFTNIQAIQDYCDSILHRNVTDDLLVKSCSPIELFFNLTVAGTESPFNVRTYLSEWIRSYTSTSITYTDIATYLQSFTAINDVTVNSLVARYHYSDGTYGDDGISSTEELELESTEMFVTLPDVAHITIVAG